MLVGSPLNSLSFYFGLFLATWYSSVFANAVETWTDATGKYQLHGEFVELKDGFVHLRTSEQEIKRIPLEKLGATSQQRVNQLLEESQSTPKSGALEVPSDLNSLNEHAKSDISPNENIVVALWKAYGFEKLDPSIREIYLQNLGLPHGKTSDYSFLTWQEFCHRQGSGVSLQADPSPLHTSNRSAVQQWLKLNSTSLDQVVEAAKKKSYYSPMINTPGQSAIFTSSIPIMHLARDLTRALIARANQSLQDGNLDDAWRDFIASYKIARLVGNEPTSTGLMLSHALEQTVCMAIVELTVHPGFTRDLAEECLTDLNSLPPASTMSEKMAVGEKAMLLDVVNQIIQKGPEGLARVSMLWLESQGEIPPIKSSEIEKRGLSKNWSKDFETVWRQTPSIISTDFDSMATALKTGDPRLRLKQVSQLQKEISEQYQENRMYAIFDNDQSEQDLRDASQILSQGKLPGEVDAEDIVAYLNTMWFPDVTFLLNSEISSRVRSGTLPVVLALGAYRTENGRLPNNLKDLVPGYFPQIPVGAVFKAPLVYKKSGDGYSLYSLGPDGIDDGGNMDQSGETYDSAFTEAQFDL